MEMKTINKTSILLLTLAVAACNPLGKMAKNAENINYSITPNPLEMHNDSVALSISGKFPPKYFNKKVAVTVTPILKTAGESGEVIKEFKPITLLGEAADGEGTKISYEKGGSFTYNDKIPYKNAMEYSVLELNAVGNFKSKSKDFVGNKVGDGTIITPYMVRADDKPILGKDKYTKVVPRSIEAEIHYLINSAAVRPTEMSDADVKKMNEFIKTGIEKKYVFKGLSVSAYASPDGEISLNENLANDRAKSAKVAIENELKRRKVNVSAQGFFNEQGKGEDWDGFKRAMQQSDIKDKDLIIRILEMYPDPSKREQEIKNLAATYTEVADKILPGLRRAKITLNAEEPSKTDAQISELAKSNPAALTVEELLYAATLTNSIDEKLAIYTSFAQLFPTDWRGPNNIGYIHLLQNKTSDAKAQFEKALKMDPNNPVVNNNMGVIARINGNKEEAKSYYAKASGAGNEVNYNQGIIMIMEGNYSGAVSNMGSEKSFNASLAKLLNGDANGALSTLDASDDKTLAEGYYLKAIIGARTSNKELITANLKSAFEKDAKLKVKARKDAEFVKYRDDSDFKNLVN
jgi:tetratricopeptide (TPR) repeat protein